MKSLRSRINAHLRCWRALAVVCMALICGLLQYVPARAAETYVQFRLEIEAPAQVRGDLAGLELQRWQGYETMTPALLERLAAEAGQQARDILATRGFFSPAVRTEIDAAEEPRVVRISVDPGVQTRIAGFDIRFSGAIAQGDALDAAAMARVRAEWALPVGEAFTQDAWDRAKGLALLSVARQRYAGARLVASEARIDPQSHSARLLLEIDSGPALRFGELQVSGLSRYGEPRVRNLWTAAAGAPFDREELERFERRLAATQYFASVRVEADPDGVRDGVIPVRVAVLEGPAKRLNLGLSYSTDTLLGATLDYRDSDFAAGGVRLRSLLNLQTRVQSAEGYLDLPERRSGWADKLGARLRRTDIENLVTEELTFSLRRSAIDERRQPSFGATLSLGRQRADGVLSENVYATLFDYAYTWRTTDNLLSPRRGAVIHAEAGVAPPGLSTRGFGRTVGRLAWFLPVATDHDLVLRAEAGAVLASSSAGIPQSMLFRTGGAATVRGYNFESLGVQKGTAVLGGRYLLAGSAEYIRWLWADIGVAAFVDAGNVTDDRRSFSPAVGYGVGVRAKSPVGPLRIDLAYGRDDRRLRLHFSAGIAF